jgi:phosphoribosylaminoimidazolecarboxamide formyltransferase/IMP cyclohydrolase
MQLNRVNKIDNYVSVKNVLISTADKSGLDYLAAELVKINPDVRIFSTGGTYSLLSQILGPAHSGALKRVSDYTGQPEMQGGLVKTLDFKIYLGLLSEKYNDSHQADLQRTGAVEIDMVVVNLYPFNETINKTGVSPEDARANIDIGGPCMLRASAKNYLRVASVCNPDDYSAVIEELNNNNGALSFGFRYKLARKTFKHTAEYDNAIASYLSTVDEQQAEKVYSLR